MRKEVGKAVYSCFAEQLAHAFPNFKRVKLKNVPKGYFVFRHQPKEGLLFFIVLDMAPKYDEFTVEIGWSKNGKFPSYLAGSPLENRKDGLKICLCQFWSVQDIWWEVGHRWTDEEWDQYLFEDKELEDEPLPRTLAKVPSKVDDAIQKLKKYAIPYFEQVASK